MPDEKAYKVRALRCSHTASPDEIYEKLKTITAPLSRSWEKLENAKKVVLKVNMQMRTDNIRRVGGRRQELVDEDVLRASLRLLRERTDAQLVVLDSSFASPGERPGNDFNMRPIFEEFGIPYIEAGDPPFTRYRVPGGGLMFSEYQLSSVIGESDAFVSIAKMKNHAFMGITLCLKNLFGLPPVMPHGRVRSYYHHVIRLSYVLPDLGLITQPCLNIIDALTGQKGCEWGGEGRVCDALIAGDHVIATDACGAYLMGHDPTLDWPSPPYRRDRSPIKVAADHGFGTVNLEEIDFETDLTPPLAEFNSFEYDPPELIMNLRRSACEQALIYRSDQNRLAERYAGRFIYLQDGEVVWSGNDPSQAGAVQEVSGEKKDHAVWLKLADPEEREGEHFRVYEQNRAA
ncbi:MAG: DUF362 domain-containing protein [Candidatus Latescibacteria bacterium]|nr:DUF362 domain-containing protein [Candidatus Latescibacterota bacterium]